MIELPSFESFINHNGGDTSHLAEWIFEYLDSDPPDNKGLLTLYLCYHSSDSEYFAAINFTQRLVDSVLDIYEKEEKWNGRGFGDLKFKISRAAADSSFNFSLIKSKREGLFTRFRKKTDKNQFYETRIELSLLMTNDFVKPNKIGLVSRWNTPLDWKDTVFAKLSVSSDGRFAQHLENWQREARWLQPSVYLPEGKNKILIGDFPGCDIHATALSEPLIVEYNSTTDEWTWFSPTSSQRSFGRTKSKFEVTFENDTFAILTLYGESLAKKRTLEEIEKENQMPLFTVEIIGCVLPLPHPHGYGTISDDFPLKRLPDINSTIRLPGENWIYLRDKEPFLLRKEDTDYGQKLLYDGLRFSLFEKVGFNRTKREYLWRDKSYMSNENFQTGEIEFATPIKATLKIGKSSGILPDEMFIDYSDGILGRAPVNFLTSDGKNFNLQFNQSAQHPVFLLDEKTNRLLHFDPDKTKTVEIGDKADFILGATHYRLSHFYRSRKK